MPKAIGYIILEGAPAEAPDLKVVSGSSDKRVIGEGILQTAEEENRNGRCYLQSDLLSEVNCPRTKELIMTGNLRAENGHPLDQTLARQQTIHPPCCCAIFTKVWMEGNNVMGQFRGTNNEAGEEFDQDLREGMKPSWSLRALGSLENIRGRNVVKDLKIITWDRVIYPSHPHAYTTRLVTESANMDYNVAKDKLDTMNKKGSIIPITNESVLSYIKSESANIKSLLNQIDFMYESTQLLPNNKVQMVAKNGDVFVVNLENYIANDIENYCANLRKNHYC